MAWPAKLAETPQVQALLRLGGWAVAGGFAATWLIGGPMGFWLLAGGGAMLGASLALMGWRWLSIGDSLARELRADRRFAAERERNRGVNRLQDKLAATGDGRAVRALAGLRDLGVRAVALETAEVEPSPADAEVLAVIERMRAATLATLERLAALRKSVAGRGGPGEEEARAAADRMLDDVEDAVSRMAVAVGRVENSRLSGGPARRGAAGAEPAGLDELSAELEGAMAVARRVEERLAEIEGGPGHDPAEARRRG